GIGSAESVGMTSHLPMATFGWNGEFQIEGNLPWSANEAPLVEYRWIFADYVKTMGVRLIQGRMLDDRDRSGSTSVLINQTMAQKFWPGQDPIGKRFGQGRADKSQWYQVVGVLSDVRSIGLASRTPCEFYRSFEDAPMPFATVVIRTRAADPMTVVPTARQIVASIDPLMPISQVQTMEHVVSESVGQPRLMSALTVLFGGLAGLLAMVGVHCVMGYKLRRQGGEFGIRIALGADQTRVRNLVVGRGLTLAAIGVALGGFGAWMLTGVMRAMLHDVKPTDPAVFAGTAAVVLLVAVLASYL